MAPSESVRQDPARLDPVAASHPFSTSAEPDAFVGATVLGDVLALERRPSRVLPLLDAWVGRFSGAVGSGDHAAANRWLRVLTDRSWPDDLRPQVDAALDRVTSPELVEAMVVELFHDGDESGAGADLVAAWGRRLVPLFVDWIVAEDAPVSRKHVVDHLAVIGRNDVEALIPHLEDPRWFVVRNFATAVGRSGSAAAIEPLQAQLSHEDDRVRVEALRGIAAIGRAGSVTTIVEALDDRSSRVRQAAISLLRAVGSDDVVALAEQVIAEKRIDAADARKLVELIAERPSAASVPALERIAARRRVFGAQKAARDAARSALIGSAS
jgi:hypothetical protein